MTQSARSIPTPSAPTPVRNTRQKEAIRAAFLAAARPLSPDEALSEAARHVQGISAATIYRNINALVSESWLSPVEVPGEPARYEIAGKGHHHHFHCQRCGRIFDLPSDLPGALPSTMPDCILLPFTPKVPSGFRVTAHELFLYGRCNACI